MRKISVREEALRILIEVEKGSFAQDLIDRNFKQKDWPQKDRGLLNELVLGVIRQKGLLDWILGSLSKYRLENLDRRLLNILRLGIYQKRFLSRIPDYALVSESVNLARLSGGKKAADFTNAVLRNYLRYADKIVFPDESRDLALNFSVRFSHPEWLLKRWIKRFGIEKTRLLCQFNNQLPPLTIRANTLKIARGELKNKLEKAGFRLELTKYAPEGLIVLGGGNIFRQQSFNSGFFQAQDESAMLVSHLLSPRKGEFIIDLCSAPGGKTTHLAGLMEDQGEILALDIKREKLARVEENCQRLGLNCIKTLLLRGEDLKDLKRKPEAVLLDAPCSNLGVLRRRVEAKWRITPQKIKELKKQQLKLLKRSASLLKKGGRLVYATCTITPEENEEVIGEFLEGNRYFSIDKTCPSFLKEFQGDEGFIRLDSHITDLGPGMYPLFSMDKAFMVKLVKK